MNPWWLLVIIPGTLGIGLIAGAYYLAWRIGRDL